MTESILRERGSLGSRLHRMLPTNVVSTDDWSAANDAVDHADRVCFVAYAQWPDQKTFDASVAAGTPNERASAIMKRTMIKMLPVIKMKAMDEFNLLCFAAEKANSECSIAVSDATQADDSASKVVENNENVQKQ